MSFIKSKLQTAINNNMKNTFKTLLFISLLCGVSGADEIKSVSVMEGDSVTLQTDENKILTYKWIRWRFGVDLIAEIPDRGNIKSSEVTSRFSGKLKLDNQTGSLTITNTRTIHSGAYKIQTDTGTPEKTFTLTVYESPSVIDPHTTEVTSVSVIVGESVTLNTDIINPYGDELIVWRFGHILIAKHDKENNKISYPDERFKDRIHLDQTGSLIISNSRTADTGDYKLKISSNRDTIYKRFSLYASESPSEIDRGTTEVKSMEVMEGEPVPLNTDINPHGDELIVWRFGDILIAKDDKKNNKISFSPDERFKGRIHLDQTGSLIISNSRITDTGEYRLKISSNRETKHKRFSLYVRDPPPLSAGAKAGIIVAVLLIVAAAAAVVIYYIKRQKEEQERQKEEQERQKEEQERQKEEIERLKEEMERQYDKFRTVSVMKGKSVTLITDDDHIKKDYVNVYYGGTFIAQIREGKITHIKDVFSGRLELDHKTGSLIIKNSRDTDAGIFLLKIKNSTGEEITYKRIIVTVSDEVIRKMVKEGNSVCLYTGVPELQKDAEVELKFEDTVIAEKQQKDKTISLRLDDHDGIFRGRLEVDKQTGSLTITDIRTDQSGVYELKIISRRATLHKKFKVTVIDQASVEALFQNKADDGVNESAGLLNNAAADGVNEKWGTSSV